MKRVMSIIDCYSSGAAKKEKIAGGWLELLIAKWYVRYLRLFLLQWKGVFVFVILATHHLQAKTICRSTAHWQKEAAIKQARQMPKRMGTCFSYPWRFLFSGIMCLHVLCISLNTRCPSVSAFVCLFSQLDEKYADMKGEFLKPFCLTLPGFETFELNHTTIKI